MNKMARTPRTYSRIEAAEEMIKKLCEEREDLFWAVRPEAIVVMGIDNKERTEKAKKKKPDYAVLHSVKGAKKALLRENSVKASFIIELFYSDWHEWSDNYRMAVLATKLLEITPDDDILNKPDCVGFRVLTDVLGVNWQNEPRSVKNILSDDIEFDLELRPGLDVEEEDDD
jgi:hypothetical protein